MDTKNFQNPENSPSQFQSFKEAGTSSVAFTTGNPSLEVQSGTVLFFEGQPVDSICDWHTELQHSGTGLTNDGRMNTFISSLRANAFSQDMNQPEYTQGLPSPENRSPLLALLSVPSHMVPTDLLHFLGPIKPHIRAVRVLRHCISSTQYIVLMRLADQKCADEAFLALHGRPYSTLEDYICCLAFAHAVSFDDQNTEETVLSKDDNSTTPSYDRTPHPAHFRSNSGSALPEIRSQFEPSFADTDSRLHSLNLSSEQKMEECPAPARNRRQARPKSEIITSNDKEHQENPTSSPHRSSSQSSFASHFNMATPKPGWLVPGFEQAAPLTCVVCLESMEGTVPQVFTTVCNHSFHIDCLVRWEDSPCPVCRFHPSRTDQLSPCVECGAVSNLWCCLLCGYVGCSKGDQANGHIRSHYLTSLHSYAIEVDTQHVWDFAGDGYVHRLVTSKTDGKLVEIPDPGSFSEHRSQVAEQTDQEIELMTHQKLEGLAYQYNTLLAQLLNEQRGWYEHQISALLEKRDIRLDQTASADGTTLLSALRAEQRSSLDRCQAAKDRLKKAQDECAFLQELNSTLISNEESWKIQLENAEKNLQEAETEHQRIIPELESKVLALMEKLDTPQETNQG